MTTANVGQALTEVVAANPAPNSQVAQLVQEAVGANPGLMAYVAQTAVEVVWGAASIITVLTWDGRRVDGTVVG